MKINDNPYYRPEKSGLSIFWEIDTAGSYEFDMFVIWERQDDKSLWWGTDSGCSCPTPFESHVSLDPINSIYTLGKFKIALEEHRNIPKDDVQRALFLVKEHLKL